MGIEREPLAFSRSHVLNVFEWCSDVFDKSTGRVLKGGSWYDSPAACRSAARFSSGPETPLHDRGFRIAFRPE